MPAPTSVITCIDLSKTYGRRITALQNLNLTIDEGMSFGLLGENGAGKSTLVRLIMGFIFPTSGRLSVLGEENVARAHPRIGYVHERPIFDVGFTGRAYLSYLAQLSGLWDRANTIRVNAMLNQVNLREAANYPIRIYSKGMLQRLAIAQALISDPTLLILDEPTSGLDPRSQWEVRQIITGFRQQGKTILLCSHDLAEVETLCDTVGILRRGQMILTGNVAKLLQSQGVVEIVLADEQSAWEVAERLKITKDVIETQGTAIRVTEAAKASVLTKLVNANIPILSLNPISETLEEVYVRTTSMTENTTRLDRPMAGTLDMMEDTMKMKRPTVNKGDRQ